MRRGLGRWCCGGGRGGGGGLLGRGGRGRGLGGRRGGEGGKAGLLRAHGGVVRCCLKLMGCWRFGRMRREGYSIELTDRVGVVRGSFPLVFASSEAVQETRRTVVIQ